MSTLGVAQTLHHARITGIGGYRPERVVPNSEIVAAIDSSDEWIRERSGIASRHKAAPDESVVDMAEHPPAMPSPTPGSTPRRSVRWSWPP